MCPTSVFRRSRNSDFQKLPKLLNSGRAGLPAHQRPALGRGLFSSRRSPPLSSGAQVNPPPSRLSAWLPNLLRGFREEAHRVAGRPEAAAKARLIFSALPATTFVRRAGESAALPPLADRAFRHARTRKASRDWPACTCTGKRTANIPMSR
jgi:hypothetical protein